MQKRTLAGFKHCQSAARRALWAGTALIFAIPTVVAAADDAGDTSGAVEVAAANADVLISPTQIVATRAELRADMAERYDRIATLSARIEAVDATATPSAWTSGRQREVRSPLLHELEAVRAEFVALESQLEDLEETFADESPWAEFGLSFAVFPVDDVDEFVNSWGNARSGGRRHKGTDILAPMNTALFALEDGVVERSSNSRLGGISVYLLGDSGARYYYAHLSSLGEFGEGERISAGQTIGYNGDSGNARGTPHLHFQVAPTGGNDWTNPFPLLIALWEYERGADGPPVRVWS